MVETITPISLSSMPNGLYVQFMSDVDFQIQRVTPEALRIKKCYETFSAGRSALDEVFIKQAKDNRTIQLADCDSFRDRTFRCVSGHANADLNSSDASKQAKAQILVNKLNSVGYLPGMGNNEESARMDDLGKDLKAEPLSEIITALGLTAEVNAMIEANNAFITLSRERTESRKSEVTYASRDIRNVLDPAYRDIIAVVNSQLTLRALMDEESGGGGDRPEIESVDEETVLDPLTDFAQSINAIIREYKTKTAQSGTTAKKEDDRPVIE